MRSCSPLTRSRLPAAWWVGRSKQLWTTASRKAMLPVFEGNKGLLFYPVQYEGLEASPYIFYTGATTNQQIIPALDYLRAQGMTRVYLVGSDYVFPRTANKIIKAYAEANGMEILGE